MQLSGASALVTGGASGLGLATVRRLTAAGASVTIVDLPGSDGEAIAAAEGAFFAPADVTNADDVAAAVASAQSRAPLRAVVTCAGRGALSRVVQRDGTAGDSALFAAVVNVNLVGTFTVLAQSAAVMAGNDAIEGERGVVVMTASAAAFEGQIGQMAYSASKAGVVGMTLTAARDLASKQIRVCSIAPGLFDTPMLARLDDNVRASLAASVPHPQRLGSPTEFARLAVDIVENPMLNGETIRLDGAIRMSPR